MVYFFLARTECCEIAFPLKKCSSSDFIYALLLVTVWCESTESCRRLKEREQTYVQHAVRPSDHEAFRNQIG